VELGEFADHLEAVDSWLDLLKKESPPEQTAIIKRIINASSDCCSRRLRRLGIDPSKVVFWRELRSQFRDLARSGPELHAIERIPAADRTTSCLLEKSPPIQPGSEPDVSSMGKSGAEPSLLGPLGTEASKRSQAVNRIRPLTASRKRGR